MASIREKKQNHSICYHFTCCLGRDANGKQIRRYSTWIAPEGMTASKARKAAEREAAAWEQQMKAEFEKDLRNPERAKIKELVNDKLDFSLFITEVWFPVRIDNGEYKAKTVSYYSDTAKNIAAYFKGFAIKNISSISIQRFLVYLRTEKCFSSQYVQHHFRALRMIFDFAVKQGIILDNPMHGVDKPRLEKKKVDALSENEAKVFFAALGECPLDFRCMLQLLITTGVRRGELVGIKWCDIDYEQSTLRIERNVVYTIQSGTVVNTPKTAAGFRTVPLLHSTMAMLRQLKAQRQRENPDTILNDSFVFPGKESIFLPRDPNAVTRRIKRFMARNDLPSYSAHDIRHSCATLLLSSGADIKSVQEILGHANASTTLNFYVRSDLEQMKTATNKLGAAFNL